MMKTEKRGQDFYEKKNSTMIRAMRHLWHEEFHWEVATHSVPGKFPIDQLVSFTLASVRGIS